MEQSQTIEDYLKAIFKLAGSENGTVSTSSICDTLNIKGPTVSDMLKKLNAKGLIEYKPYYGAKLTEAGNEIAVKIVRKHRLWETFLVNYLNFKWDEVHDIAEQLEHIDSPELTDRLDTLLGNPSFDPHGDPIPKKGGEFYPTKRTTLREAKKGDAVSVTGVKDHSAEFLRFLEKLKIGIGVELKVVDIHGFDDSIEVSIQGGPELTISKTIGGNLFVDGC